MEETKTIKLTKPIQAHGETIDEMVVKRPTGKDLFDLDAMDTTKPSFKDMVRVVQVCQKIPLSSVKEMDGGDVMAVAKVLYDFLGSSQEPGESSAQT